MCFSGKVIGIRSLISYEGDTVENLRKDFEEAVDPYLADCAERGIEPESYENVTDECRVPNAETLEAFKELEEMKKNPSRYNNSVEELMEDLQKDNESDDKEDTAMIEEIMSMLSDMDEEQLQNVYDYVCDEYAEKNHESNNWEIIQRLAAENEHYKTKLSED